MKCVVVECSHDAHVTTSLATTQALQVVFPSTCEALPDLECPQPLCKEHYWELYSYHNPAPRCKTFSKYILDPSKTSKCHNANLVQKLYAENIKDVGQIQANDHVCNACYKSQLVVIKLVQHTHTSTDEDLEAILTQLREQIPEIDQVSTVDGVIMCAVTTTAIMVEENLLKQQAMLLPDIYDTFDVEVTRLLNLRDISSGENILNIVPPSVAS